MNWYLKVLKQYSDFNGRARRKEYWMFTLFSLIISIVLSVIDVSTGMFDPELGRGLTSTIFSMAVLIPTIAVGVRRMHDVGKSGWFLLIPIYNFILAVTEGEKKTNEYGPDPKNENGSNPDLIDDILLD